VFNLRRRRLEKTDLEHTLPLASPRLQPFAKSDSAPLACWWESAIQKLFTAYVARSSDARWKGKATSTAD
jgi:hypothetical protein